MKNIGPFQVIILFIFAFIGLIAVLLFAGVFDRGGGSSYGGQVTMWGSLPQDKISSWLIKFNETNKDSFSLNYVFVEPDKFEEKLIDSIASGGGPDVIILPSYLIYRQQNKITKIPYDSYSERSFRDSFVDGAEIFLNKDGILALPFYLDPLVMYWNKDLFSNAGIAKIPKNWEEFLEDVPRLTVGDKDANISQSALAMGTFNNISHAEDILTMLMIQANAKITGRVEDSGQEVTRVLMSSYAPAIASVLKFYTQFSDPAKESYSWNTALPESIKAFESGLLASYLGYASDIVLIKNTNPHLNFDVTVMPQRDGGTKKSTFANFYGLAVLKSSQNANTAFRVIYAIDTDATAEQLSKEGLLPSARRTVLANLPSDPIHSVFYNSAIISQTFLNLSPIDSRDIFKNMVSTVTSGRESAEKAVSVANIQMARLLSKDDK